MSKMNPKDKMQDGATKKNLPDSQSRIFGFIKKINLELDNKEKNKFASAAVYVLFVVTFTCIADFVFFEGGTPVRLAQSIFKDEVYSVLGSTIFWSFLSVSTIIFGINHIQGISTLNSLKSVAKVFLPILLLLGVLDAFDLPNNIPELKRKQTERSRVKLEEKQKADFEKKLMEEKQRKAQLASQHRLEGKTLNLNLPPEKKFIIDNKIRKDQKIQFLSFDGPFEARVQAGKEECCWKEIKDSKIKKADASGALEVLTGYKEVNLTIVIEEEI